MQSGPALFWRNLRILDTLRDHISPDCARVAGLGVVSSADFDISFKARTVAAL